MESTRQASSETAAQHENRDLEGFWQSNHFRSVDQNGNNQIQNANNHVSLHLESEDRQTQTESVDTRDASTITEYVVSFGKMQVTNGYKEVTFEECTENGQSFQVAVTVFKKPVTDKYKHFVTVFQRQRCPFLVPILKIVEDEHVDDSRERFQLIRPRECFQLISPKMVGGSLEAMLSGEVPNSKVDTQAKAITIAYQLLEAITFLHSRNVVHGDLHESKVLFDVYGNVRLVDYGMYTAEETVHTRNTDAGHDASFNVRLNKHCFAYDLWSFARILLRLLMPLKSEEQSQSAAMNDLTKSQSTLQMIRRLCNTCSSVTFLEKEGHLYIQQSFECKSLEQRRLIMYKCIDDSMLEVNEDRTAGEALITKSFNCLSFIWNHVDKVWPIHSTTRKIIHVLLKCVWMQCDRSNSDVLRNEMKSIMKLCRLDPVIGTQDNTNCWYCTVEPMHPDSAVKFRLTECPETCAFLRTCRSCMVLFGNECHVDNDVCNHSSSDKVENCLNVNMCPDHECPVEPVIGGGRSHAVILHGTGQSGIAINTERDARKIVEVAIHPKIMRIPLRNVHSLEVPEIPDKPRKGFGKHANSNFNAACQVVEDKINEIVKKKPSYFLFFYTGHNLVKMVNDRKCRSKYAELVKRLKKYIRKIAEVCPRILVIIDCCYASAVAEELFPVKLDDDAHVEWHAKWISCRQKQESNIVKGHELSSFTELVVSALKGGIKTRCPLYIQNCYVCLKYRASCNENGYVTLSDGAEFVRYHMHRRQCDTRESPSDEQDTAHGGNFFGNPVISFYNKEPTLYTVFVEDLYKHTIHPYPIDHLCVKDIWRLTDKHRPEHADHMKFYERHHYSTPLCESSSHVTDMETGDWQRILDVVSRDNKSLLVKIESSTSRQCRHSSNITFPPTG